MGAGRRIEPDKALNEQAGFDFSLGPKPAPAPAPPQPAGQTAAPPSRPSRSAEKPHHVDHRARLRKRFEEAGPAALADYELLELLLFRALPRIDTKPLAKRLIARFGDFAAVLGADPLEIARVEGAGPGVALELKAIQAAMERAAGAEARRRPVVGSWSSLINYCRLALQHETREQVRVLFLDRKNQLIADEVQNEGTLDHAPLYPREIVRRALEVGAAAVILVHNHPSGDPTPSTADIAITREVIAAAKPLGLQVHDHIVIGRHGVASLKTLGLI